MKQEAPLSDLADALRWRWKLALLIAVGVLLGATLYVEALPAEYEGRAVLAFAPRPDVPSAGADTVRLVVPKYVAYVAAPSTVREVADEIGVEPDLLDDAVEASPEADSGNLEIVVSLTDPQIAADAANAFAREAEDLAVGDDLLVADVVVEAVVSDTPSGPPRRLFEASALAVGILAGLTAAILMERARPRVRSWRDIHQITGYTVMGRIPRARMLKARPEEGLAHPVVGASFRNLRTNVERLAQDRSIELEAIVITSPTNSEGKSTVASLLAEAYARLGSRVLLVDADLRRPSLARRFKLDTSRGLSTVLRGEHRLRDAVQPGPVENMAILPTKSDAGGGDLVARNFERFLEDAKKDYDLVIVDTPPLLGTDEGRTITTLASGVLLVVRAGTMSASANEGALALDGLKAPVLGAIGNGLRRSEVGQYYA